VVFFATEEHEEKREIREKIFKKREKTEVGLSETVNLVLA